MNDRLDNQRQRVGPQFFVIGTKYSREDDVLPEMLAHGVVSTGFTEDLDLTPIIGATRREVARWINAQLPGESGVARGSLARFASIQPGDLIALKAHSAPRGRDPRLVIARYAIAVGVDKAWYRRIPGLGHSIEVDFLDEQEPVELRLGYGGTIHQIVDHERISLIFSRYAVHASDMWATGSGSVDKATHSSLISPRGSYLMSRVHNQLQNELRRSLEALFGQGAVLQEKDYVDLRVSLPRREILFEVKSSRSPTACIREALGQLLQYAWRLDLGGREIEYVVVGPEPTVDSDARFLAHLVRETSLNLTYCTPSTYAPSD